MLELCGLKCGAKRSNRGFLLAITGIIASKNGRVFFNRPGGRPMLISETTGDFERFAGVEYAAEAGDQLAACFEAAPGCIQPQHGTRA